MNVGDWIHASHNMNKITGFITASFNDMIAVQVTIPHNYGHIVIRKEEAIPGDDTIWMDDIPTLINLSIHIGDAEWLEKWRNEMSLWKPIEHIEGE